jgi:hypothetical protein
MTSLTLQLEGDALREAAASRVTAGKKREKVQRDLYEDVVKAMEAELERAGLAPKVPSKEIAQSILGQLPPEAQHELLNGAVQAILKPGTDSWNRGKSPLEQAFERAVQDVAQKEALRLVSENVELKAKMEELLRQTADRVLNSDHQKLAERMADAFVQSMRRD